MRHAAGFTLIEILVVVMIVGIIATLAMLSSGLAGSQAKVPEEARRLARLIELHCEEAVLWGREAGIRIDRGGYAFSVWDGEGWAPADAPQLRPHLLPDGIALAFAAGQPPTEEPDAPQLVCWSSGELTPFQMVIVADGGRRFELQGLADGSVTLPGWRGSDAG